MNGRSPSWGGVKMAEERRRGEREWRREKVLVLSVQAWMVVYSVNECLWGSEMFLVVPSAREHHHRLFAFVARTPALQGP